MDNTYKIATLNNNESILEKITKYETELSRLVGQDVVLIAYTNQTQK